MTPARVVLVDDTADIRLLLRALLAEVDGVDVVGEGGNGVEAIELAARLQPELLVLDHRMPVLDGMAALPEIWRAAPQTRVVLLSGEAGADGPTGGSVAYVEKTVSGLRDDLIGAACVLDCALGALSGEPGAVGTGSRFPAAAVESWDVSAAMARLAAELAGRVSPGTARAVTVRVERTGLRVRVTDSGGGLVAGVDLARPARTAGAPVNAPAGA